MIKYFFILIISLAFIQTVFAQQPSVIWDEATKSWISGPATAPAPALTNPTAQTQLPPPQTTVQQQQPQIIQTVPTTPGGASVDFGTLMTVLTPILAGIGGMFLKNRKDLEKKEENLKKQASENDDQIRKQTIDEIKAAILPTIKQIAPVAELTAKQSAQINQLAEEFYKLAADRANDIHDKPEIKQQTLMEDVVKSKIVAEQAKNGSSGSIVWDDIKKELVSK